MLRTARRTAKNNNVENPNNYYDHSQEVAVPLQTPTFQTMHRCFKCRSIYRYNIPAWNPAVEGDTLDYFGDGAYPWNACRETL